MRKLKAVGALALLAMSAPALPQGPAIQLWRLDCGSIDIDDLGAFSDTGLYAGQKKTLAASCYLIRNGDKYLLWDTGLDGALAGKPKDKEGSFLKEKIVTQLARIGVKTEAINFVGISHYHYDHTGQIADFPGATLLEGTADWGFVKKWPAAEPRYRHWLTGGGKVEPVEGD